MLEWLALEKLLTAELGRSLLTALFGAGLGAFAAQSLAAKIREREERLRTVRTANAATMLVYTITDSMIGFKHQIIKPMVDQYMTERQRVIDEASAARNRPRGAYDGQVVIFADMQLQAFSAPWTPLKELQEIVFKQISPPLRPTWLLGTLSATIATLERLANERNTLLHEFREASGTEKDMVPVFFGLHTSKGADQRYLHTVEAMKAIIDDAIWFSNTIGDDLLRYTTALRKTLPPAVRAFAPVLVSADFSRRADMMPDATKYGDYDRMRQEIRALGTGIWSAKFEALALAQYETVSIYNVM
jgi:hypothetical protein